MSTESRNLVVMITAGPNDEKASVAFTIACGGISAGLKVSIFLAACGVDIVRKRAASLVEVKPFDPLSRLIEDFMSRGGIIWACTPCTGSRGYEKQDLIEGVAISGASPMHEIIQAGGATLSF